MQYTIVDEVPTRLRGPADPEELSTATGPMPLQQVLPLGEVSWQNFEKLCLRLILRRGTIWRCALYGVPGQYQAGIDFYAVHADGSYSTYQCRRVQTMTAASIAEAVNDFLGGPWSARSQQFTLCTSFDLSDTSLQDEIVKQEEL